MSILVIYGAARKGGNTEQLTEQAVSGIEGVTRVYLQDKQITPIVDQRHVEGGFVDVDDDFEQVILQMMEHDKLIFATPLYWYSMSSLMKTFVDRWSQALRSTKYDFKAAMKDKETYLVVTGGPTVRKTVLSLIIQFKATCDFMGMNFADYLLGQGGMPGDILKDERALREASLLNNRLRSIKTGAI